MKTNCLKQPILLKEASEALIEKLGVAKASEFWTSFSYNKKNYTALRKKLFKNETVASLAKKIKQFEKK